MSDKPETKEWTYHHSAKVYQCARGKIRSHEGGGIPGQISERSNQTPLHRNKTVSQALSYYRCPKCGKEFLQPPEGYEGLCKGCKKLVPEGWTLIIDGASWKKYCEDHCESEVDWPLPSSPCFVYATIDSHENPKYIFIDQRAIVAMGQAILTAQECQNHQSISVATQAGVEFIVKGDPNMKPETREALAKMADTIVENHQKG